MSDHADIIDQTTIEAQALEIERLRAENAELLKDRKRLEWMVDRGAEVFPWDDGEYTVTFEGNETSSHNDWRDSIDEAMSND